MNRHVEYECNKCKEKLILPVNTPFECINGCHLVEGPSIICTIREVE